MDFDPNAAAAYDGLYGLPYDVDEARFVVLGVPFDATTSYRDGTRHGPAAILEASAQVDLFDLDFGRTWAAKIAMLPLGSGFSRKIARLNREARVDAEPVIAAGGRIEGKKRLERGLARVNERCAEMCQLVEEEARRRLAAGQTPIVLGGDHSTPYGAIKAYAEAFPGLGVLHIDAHADLRVAYEGFEWSHASVMHNVVTKLGAKRGVASLVQVGIRDLGEDEHALIVRDKGEGETIISTHFDSRLAAAKHRGSAWAELCEEIVLDLPGKVYVSVDIDGLDPKLCPDTGTPVPGGLELSELIELFRAVVRAGKQIVGCDLNEVAPSRERPRSAWGADWNANVGARVLYKLIGACARSG